MEGPLKIRRLEERVIPGMRLGRHVMHDPRSLNFLVEAKDTAPVSKSWRRYIPILDQDVPKPLGSCTGNATVGVFGSGLFYSHLAAKRKAGLVLDEAEAVSIYSDAEKLDGGAGLPTEDEGSSGLSVAKIAQRRGLISGYLHITSVAAAHTAIQSGPFIVGSNWYSSMDEPDSKGRVTIGGTVRGGHEYEAIAYSATTGLWKLANSWSPGWGKAGYFYYSDTDFAMLLAEDGDATVFMM